MEGETIIEGPLYEARKKVYPQAVHGRFRNIKWALLVFTLGIYYFLPFIRWDRGPNMPSQAVLVDLPHRRFYFFFIELWPQEVYYFTGLLIIAAMTLFLMNSLAGRIWCGYLCWQTVWTDLFYAVERWVEGDRRERIKADKAGFSWKHFGQQALKIFIWLMIAWWTGGAWVLYFDDAPTLVKNLATFQAPLVAYIWIGILTLTTFVFAGFMREQVCIYMCPWPRIQAALTDEWALNVTYRGDRGEPRMSVKKADAAHAKGLPAGDCVDCNQCVAVCPTGVDIRHGAQLGCIQCGLCIDACDHVMTQIHRPIGLIAYDNGVNESRRAEGKPEMYRALRPRTLIYMGVIAIVSGLMLYGLTHRQHVAVTAWHQRNPHFVVLKDGGVRNDYDVRFQNRQNDARTFVLTVDGAPAGARVHAIGAQDDPGVEQRVEVGPDQTRELRVSVSVPRDNIPEGSIPIVFRIVDPVTGEAAMAKEHFLPK